MLHVAAQGDQPISLYYFKNKGLDLHSRDDRESTPLHWATYSKSEVALCYLLAWLDGNFEDQDVEGYTPLHLAVKSVEQLQSTRPVRALLIKGANREAQDKAGRKPIDHVEYVRDDVLQAELRNILKQPTLCQCCMIKTPLMVVRKSISTPLLFIFLMFINMAALSIFILPYYNFDCLTWFYVDTGIFLVTILFFSLSSFINPGYIDAPQEVSFMVLNSIFITFFSKCLRPLTLLPSVLSVKSLGLLDRGTARFATDVWSALTITAPGQTHASE